MPTTQPPGMCHQLVTTCALPGQYVRAQRRDRHTSATHGETAAQTRIIGEPGMTQSDRMDLRQGVAIHDLEQGKIMRGRVGKEEAILLASGRDYFAVGASCTHYHGLLADGLVVDDTIRCPLHHACFSLRTGEALRAPALDPIAAWRVERVLDKVFVRERLPLPKRIISSATASPPKVPTSVVIVGGGAAGLAAADMLRREGYSGPLTMLSADDTPPYDRPNISKDFLAGTAPEEWMPLREARYYADRAINLILNERVVSIDVARHLVRLGDGRELVFGNLLLATGANPIRLQIPSTAGARIFYLRTIADCRAILAAIGSIKTAVIVGASFIGLEVAASLRTRGIEVHVAGLERVPLERVLGPEVGLFVQELHEQHGVTFHLGQSVARVEGTQVTLTNGHTLQAELVVLGVGVRPAIALAEDAGLALDRGITVDEYLETSAPGIFAAGDIARWPDPHSGERIRVEHWVVAQRQGQVAAQNILGSRQPFSAVPFFWSQHYDVAINYVGHAEKWDAAIVEGALGSHDGTVTYRKGERTLAVATIGRDLLSLRAERMLEAQMVPLSP
jgi:NADPH-dependent 2,4-dienoyl-CoA reductase/sulfur reductase-like enzyme/nitrite reductase/ring-hydroxylating ferredoxin subunit